MVRRSAACAQLRMVLDGHARMGAGGAAPDFDLPLLFLGLRLKTSPKWSGFAALIKHPLADVGCYSVSYRNDPDRRVQWPTDSFE